MNYLKTLNMETNIKELLKPVNRYFVDKILKGEFTSEFIHSPHVVRVMIDNFYEFTIWNSDWSDGTKVWGNCGHNFMDLEFTNEEQLKIHNMLKDRRQKWDEDEGRRLKMEEFQRLKKELQINCDETNLG